MADLPVKPSILLVEDEDAIVTMVTYNLERAGFRVRSTDNGDEALLMVEESKPDLILLDWMLPGITGIEICNNLRSREAFKAIPIIMLSARGEEDDRIIGLDCGADDYIVKPFSPNELIARINAVLRRIRPAFTQKDLTFGPVRMDLSSHEITYDDQEIHLGPTEFKILQCLMEFPSRVLSREQLINKVWGDEAYVDPRTIDVHVGRLRKAFGGLDKSFIKTIRSAGYCLKLPDEEE